MQLKDVQREVYEKPIVEIVTFSIEESIAMSINGGSDTICVEELG